MTAIAPLTTCAACKALEAHYLNIRDVHLRTLFAEDAARGARMAAEAVGLYFDYSKHRITDETLTLLLHLADESGLGARIEAMFRGDKINVTEKRTILHVALRVPKGHSIIVDGKDVVPPVHALLEKMTTFSNRVGSGEWTGYAGKPIHKAINIGIGGSELGPVMAYVKVETHSEEHVFEVQVYLDDLDPEAVRVELYADSGKGKCSTAAGDKARSSPDRRVGRLRVQRVGARNPPSNRLYGARDPALRRDCDPPGRRTNPMAAMMRFRKVKGKSNE